MTAGLHAPGLQAGDDRTPAADRPAGWVVLAGPAGAGTGGRARQHIPRTRDAVLQVIAIALVLVAVVGFVGALIVKRLAEQQSVHDVAQLSDVLARSVVQPALTDAMATDPAVATRALDPIVRDGLLDSSLVRVKLWSPTGLVLYSDEARLVGRTFALDDEARQAFAAARLEADVSDLDRPENRFERGQGKLLEVYRPVWTPSGRPLMLETYFRYDVVRDRSSGLWRGFAGITISSIVALLVLLIPLVAFLLSRTRRAHEQRQAMAQRALDASDEERRRIGASLHDGIVQELVGASFDIAGRAEQAASLGGHEHARVLGEAATTVRGTVAGLRSLLVDIHPTTPGAAGLPAALAELCDATSRDDCVVRADVDEHAAASLPAPARDEVFRVARECLRNAAKHARASTVDVVLHADADERVRLEIADDGTGFDATAAGGAAAAGHLGLQLIADAARRCDATLTLWSQPGLGTRVRLLVPIR